MTIEDLIVIVIINITIEFSKDGYRHIKKLIKRNRKKGRNAPSPN